MSGMQDMVVEEFNKSLTKEEGERMVVATLIAMPYLNDDIKHHLTAAMIEGDKPRFFMLIEKCAEVAIKVRTS